MEFLFTRNSLRLKSLGFQEIVRPLDAPEVSTDTDWLPFQSLAIRFSMELLSFLVSWIIKILGYSASILFQIIRCLEGLLIPLIFHEMIFIKNV